MIVSTMSPRELRVELLNFTYADLFFFPELALRCRSFLGANYCRFLVVEFLYFLRWVEP